MARYFSSGRLLRYRYRSDYRRHILGVHDCAAFLPSEVATAWSAALHRDLSRHSPAPSCQRNPGRQDHSVHLAALFHE